MPADTIQHVPAPEGAPAVTEEEAEARLHREGYECIRWYDVPGASYPRHRHDTDECIWVLKGEIQFASEGAVYALRPGDKLYLPARAPHTARVTAAEGCTYLVGRLERARGA